MCVTGHGGAVGVGGKLVLSVMSKLLLPDSSPSRQAQVLLFSCVPLCACLLYPPPRERGERVVIIPPPLLSNPPLRPQI